MVYLFKNVYPNSGLLPAKDLTPEFVDNLLKTTEVILDDSFDRESAIDILTLYAANKILVSLRNRNIEAESGITRMSPCWQAEWNIVIGTPGKITGMNTVAMRTISFKQFEYQEILTIKEIVKR